MAARFPGWTVVWVAFTLTLVGYGVCSNGPPVFLATLHETRGWPIATISMAITAHFLTSALCVLFLPEVYRRVSLAAVSIVGAMSMAAGVVAWSFADEPWQLYPAAFLTGVGYSTVSVAALNTIVGRWFERERPKAISLVLNGVSVSGLVFPALWLALIGAYGFQTASLVIAAGVLAVLCPLALLYLNRRPEHYGLGLDGRVEVASEAASVQPAQSRRALFADARLRTLAFGFAIGSFAQVGLLSHFFARMVPDLGATGAALAFSLMMGVAIVSRTSLGFLIGEQDRRRVAALNFLTQVAGVALLALSRDPIGLFAGCVLFGLGVGNVMSLPTMIAQKEFDRADVGTVVSMVSALNQMFFAFAPATLGLLRDATGDYRVPFALVGIALTVGAVVVAFGRRVPLAMRG